MYLVPIVSKTIQRPKTTIAAAVLSLVDAAIMGFLSFFEHSRSLRSSALLNAYLFFALLLGAVQCRTLWLVAKGSVITLLFTSALGMKAVILLLEAQGKTMWVRSTERERSPEETAGIWNLSLFFWLNGLIRLGNTKVLTLDDLYPLPKKIAAETLQQKFWKDWEHRESKGDKSLILVVGKTLRWDLLAPIVPRLALIGFSFSQPFLINRVLKWLENPPSAASANYGYGLIGATALIYTGITISTSWYWRCHQRALTMVRGMLVPAIFKRTTELSLTALDDSAAVTLMSTDIEKIQNGCRNLHEAWANTIEVGLASWLLKRELGLAFLAPIVVVILCIVASALLGKITSKRQAWWMTKTQKRVGVTANIILNMTSLKMSGLTNQMGSLLQGLRIEELRSASQFRLLVLVSALISLLPLLLSPVITFAVTSRHLDTTRIFTSLSYLLLLSDPLTQLFQSVPQIIAAVTCFARVEEFLEAIIRIDIRKVRATRDLLPKDTTIYSDVAIVIRNGQFGWEEGKITMSNINLTIPRSKLTIIVGPVASGKSTLCKVFLGETPMAEGDVAFSGSFSHIGFCDQAPYLANGTIKENIIGFSNFDQFWYDEVIEATALRQDLDTFSHGDESVIGTNGKTLSGGQRQRVAVARALYAKSEIYVFDDALSGLDANTEDHVFGKVFGPEGLLRRCNATVVMSSSSVKHLPSANHIIVLGAEGKTLEEGSCQSLFVNQEQLYGLNMEPAEAQELEIETKRSTKKQESGSLLDASKPNPELDNRARRIGDIAVYRYYFASLGATLLVPFLAFGIKFGFLYNFSSVWLKFWSDFNTKHPDANKNSYFICVYALFQVLCLLAFALFLKHNLTTMVVKSGTLIHQRALSTAMNAPLAFFGKTDIGSTTNRFSQDMSFIDTDLAFAFSTTTLTGFSVLGQATVIGIASPYVSIGYPILIGVLYGIQKYYIRTSRQLRFMDLEAKSPL